MNVFLLEMKMKQAGISVEEISKYLEIDTSTFYRKKVGSSDFSRKEIQKIRSKLHLSSEEVENIFFDD